MTSFASSVAFVVLHIGQAVTFGEYLYRVLVYSLAFTGVGVAIFWGLRVLEIVRSEINGRGGIDDDEP